MNPLAAFLTPQSLVVVGASEGAEKIGGRLMTNLLRLGFTEADFAGGGSERLLDALVAWGDEDAILARVREHHDAGADHVCVQALASDGLAREQWRRLAAVLTG